MINRIMALASQTGNKQFETLDRVAQNIANINTFGYKVQRMDQVILPDGRLENVPRKDFSQGSPLITRNELDVAIEGPGFIPVTQADGTVAYTRDGAFTVNAEGMLITHRGDMVGEGIQLPAGYDQLVIKEDGTVQVYLKKGDLTPQEVGKLSLVAFPNPEGLKPVGYNKLLQTEQSGEPQLTEAKLLQGKLERSNVNVYYQIDQILRLNASVISNLRLIKFSDELFRLSANLRQ